ncbi:MAG: DUF2721 domain-containing protein, partial [Chloroflexota bacterium]
MIEVAWLAPLLLLPGVALLIMSTSVRYGQIHTEVHHLVEENYAIPAEFKDMLAMRACFFRNALLGLYTSVVFFVSGSVVGALMEVMGANVDLGILVFALLGIICVVFSSIELVRESVISLEILEYHIKEV